MQNKVMVDSDKKRTGSPFPENTSCPRCGGEMVVSSRQVVSKYPAPPLERFECSESSCNYTRYVKLNSEDNPNGNGPNPPKELK